MNIDKLFIDDLAKLKVAVKTVTTTYQVLVTDYRINCDATLDAFVVTLPSIAAMILSGNGIFHIKKVDSSANAITVNQGG